MRERLPGGLDLDSERPLAVRVPEQFDRATSRTITVVICAVSLMLIMVLSLWASWVHLCLLAAAVFTLARRRPSGAYLSAVILLGFGYAYRELDVFGTDIGVADVAFTAASLVLIGFLFRCSDLNDSQFSWSVSRRPGVPVSQFRMRHMLRPAMTLPWRIALAISVALLILWLFPVESLHGNLFKLKAMSLRVTIILWLLALAMFVFSITFATRTWQLLRPLQARVYLLRQFCDQLGSEMRVIEVARQRYERGLHKGES